MCVFVMSCLKHFATLLFSVFKLIVFHSHLLFLVCTFVLFGGEGHHLPNDPCSQKAMTALLPLSRNNDNNNNVITQDV